MSAWQRWIVGSRERGRRSTPSDREHGLETSGLIDGWRLGVGHRHAEFSTAYLGVPPPRMRAVLERWRSSSGVMPSEE